MHLIEIPDIKLKKYFPEDLSECDKLQYIHICQLLFEYKAELMTLDDWKVKALYFLLDLQPSKSHKSVEAVKFANIYQVSQVLDSFFERNEQNQLEIKTYYINNPLDFISNGLNRWYGPTDGFQNVKFGEYVDALNHYADFNETQEVKYLYFLMATFYRKPKSFLYFKKRANSYDGDPRINYNQDNMERVAHQLRHFPMGIVYGFYLLFASFQKYISTAQLFIEGKTIELSVLFKNTDTQVKQSDIPDLGMRSILYSMAESQIFGPMNEVRNTSLYEILIRMYDIHKRNQDAIAQSKS